MGYYVPNKVKPVCYNCPFRTNKYCGLLTEHDYLGNYPFNFEPYPYCPLIEVADHKTEPQNDEFENYDREMLILLIECQRERIENLLAKDETQTEREGER